MPNQPQSGTALVWLGAAMVMAGVVILLTFVVRYLTARPNQFDAFDGYGSVVTARTLELRASPLQRFLLPFLAAVSARVPRVLRRKVPKTDSAPAKAEQKQGGSRGRQIGFGLIGAGIGYVLARLSGSSSGYLLLILATVIGAVGPDALIKRRVRMRIARIGRELPDVLDQLVISLGAGLGLDAAISRVAQRHQGLLGRELSRTMQDIRVGVGRNIAFTNLANRCGSDDLAMVTSSITQGLELGMPLAAVLESRATDLRRRRRAAAEEKAHKLSVKLSIPTVLCILPALMIVVLGPAVLQMMETGFGS